MATEKGGDAKLDNVRLADANQPTSQIVDLEDDIVTPFGPVHVVVHGERRLQSILTFHDIGMSSKTCFQSFFNYPDMQSMMKSFCIYHVNALGQHEDALTLPLGLSTQEPPVAAKDYVYPTMDQVAMMVLTVLDHYGLKTFIGFGVGAGANVLSRFALMRPERVDGLVLINGNASQSGWIEWAYQKWNSWYLKSNMMTQGVEEYLLWHWFGNNTKDTDSDLVHTYMQHIRSLNAVNLGHFISSYIKRTDLGIWRELDKMKKLNTKNFNCPIMLVAGDNSPHLDDTVEMNGRLDPTNSNWVKFSCGGMILEEVPGAMCEALRLFLQGMGYVPSLRGSVDINPSSMPRFGSRGSNATQDLC